LDVDESQFVDGLSPTTRDAAEALDDAWVRPRRGVLCFPTCPTLPLSEIRTFRDMLRLFV